MIGAAVFIFVSAALLFWFNHPKPPKPDRYTKGQRE